MLNIVNADLFETKGRRSSSQAHHVLSSVRSPYRALPTMTSTIGHDGNDEQCIHFGYCLVELASSTIQRCICQKRLVVDGTSRSSRPDEDVIFPQYQRHCYCVGKLVDLMQRARVEQ